MVTAAEAHTLGNQLQSDATQYANNVVKLLGCIQAGGQEAAAKAAIQALKLFFLDACDAGDVGRNKRQKVAAGVADKDGAAQAAALYTTWLQRQYSAYTAALLALLRPPAASPALQVSALSALLEAARHEAGPATFSAPLYAATLTAALTSPTTAPEVFAALFQRYLPAADVRYHTLRLVARLAVSSAGRSSPRSSSSSSGADTEAGGGGEEGLEVPEEDLEQQQEGAEGAGTAERRDLAAAQDVARNMFDVLAALPPRVGAAGEAGGLTSWCGAAEAGLVVAAADGAASAKLRRKRKAAAAAAAGVGSVAGAAHVAWANPKVQQRAYQAAWLAFLQGDLPGDIYRKVLLKLHSDVIPVMTDPALLADFLTHALGRGGLDGMLALHGIFVLVTRHGLEYPAFYARLYQLLTPAALRSKHRVQFFKLADAFLASGLVPAYSAAAFAKRFARLALSAPPAGAMMCIAFVHNIVRRHPSCMVLLHKPVKGGKAAAGAAGAGGGSGAGQAEPLLLDVEEPEPSQAAAAAAVPPGQPGVGEDPYDDTQADPAASRAVESSLWELEALRRHACPQVSTFVSVLDKDLGNRARTAEVDLAPLLPSSTSALITTELGRRLKSAPLAFYAQQPSSVWGGKWAAQGLASRSEVGEGSSSLEDLPGWDLGISQPTAS